MRVSVEIESGENIDIELSPNADSIEDWIMVGIDGHAFGSPEYAKRYIKTIVTLTPEDERNVVKALEADIQWHKDNP